MNSNIVSILRRQLYIFRFFLRYVDFSDHDIATAAAAVWRTAVESVSGPAVDREDSCGGSCCWTTAAERGRQKERGTQDYGGGEIQVSKKAGVDL